MSETKPTEAPKALTFDSVLKTAKEAGVSKVSFTIDVEAFLATPEEGMGQSTSLAAKVGTAYVSHSGKDPLLALAQLVERVAKHPPEQVANPGRRHDGRDATVADVHRTRPAFLPPEASASKEPPTPFQRKEQAALEANLKAQKKLDAEAAEAKAQLPLAPVTSEPTK